MGGIDHRDLRKGLGNRRLVRDWAVVWSGACSSGGDKVRSRTFTVNMVTANVQDDLTVVGEAGDGNHPLTAARDHDPDVLVMDIRMPALDGIEATRRLVAAGGRARVLMLSTFDLDAYLVMMGSGVRVPRRLRSGWPRRSALYRHRRRPRAARPIPAGDGMSGRKVIVSCAVTGSIHVPSLTSAPADHPGADRRRARSTRRRPARRSCTCTRATRRRAPDARPRRLRRSSCRRSRPTSRRGHQHHDRRRPRHDARGAHARGAARFEPELCSLNMGSMNFGLFPMLDRIARVQARLGAGATSRRAATSSSATPSRTSSAIVRELGAHGTRFEFECYDVGHLYNLAHFLERGPGRSRRSSCRRSSASSAASAPTPRTSCT